MTRFETAVQVARRLDDVFEYVADPRRFPNWNSAVERVVPTSSPAPGAGVRYVMQRRLPGGRADNELEIVAWDPPSEFAIRTTSGPTPFTYSYRFEPTDRGTLIRLAAELTGLAALAGPLVKRGVEANLATLREILEATPHGPRQAAIRSGSVARNVRR